MRFDSCDIAGVWIASDDLKADERGTFTRVFDVDAFVCQGLPDEWPQASISTTFRRGTIRGMHFQRPPFEEIKCVQCVRGAIHDVVVDLRRDSLTYLKHAAFYLSQQSPATLIVPHGCAHGYQTVTDDCSVLYRMSTRYMPGHGSGVRHDDPALGIQWPLPVAVISDQDRMWARIG